MSIIQEKRLKIFQEDFYTDPIKTIQSFIGIDAYIISYEVNNIYIDGYVIVDVKFRNLDLDPSKIYWIKFGDCKLLNIKHSSVYITKIDDINVCVIINNKYDKDDWIPLHIDITIPNNRENVYFKYFGKIIDSPFNECNSQTFVYDHYLEKDFDKTINECNESKKIFDKDVVQKSYDIINNVLLFYGVLKQQITSQSLININSLSEGTDKNKLYLIDIRKIKDIEKYKGYLVCSRYRENPWDVMFIPIPNYKLTKRKLDYLKWFMYNDYKNYTEWIKKK